MVDAPEGRQFWVAGEIESDDRRLCVGHLQLQAVNHAGQSLEIQQGPQRRSERRLNEHAQSDHPEEGERLAAGVVDGEDGPEPPPRPKKASRPSL